MASQVSLQIPKKWHPLIVGHGGAAIQELQSTHRVQIHVPARDSPSSSITITGAPADIAACQRDVDRVLGFHARSDPLVVASFTLSSHAYGRIIGPGGSTLKGIEQQSGAAINIPQRDSGSEVVTVEGSRRSIDAALTALHELTGQPINPSFQEPSAAAYQPQPSAPQESSLLSSLTSLVKERLHISDSSPSSSQRSSVSLPTVNLSADVQEVLFFPSQSSPSSFDRFLQFLRSATRTVDVAIYTISDDRISRVLHTLHEQGVRVRLFTEKTTMADQGSDVQSLANAGMEVRYDNSPFLMHHKTVVIDGVLLISGSFNWTRSASEGVPGLIPALLALQYDGVVSSRPLCALLPLAVVCVVRSRTRRMWSSPTTRRWCGHSHSISRSCGRAASP